MPVFRRPTSLTARAWPDPDAATKLAQQMRAQLAFTRGYSALSTAMLQCALEWLCAPNEVAGRLGEPAAQKAHKVCLSLIRAAQEQRSALERTLRLAAALHHAVLSEDPRVAPIAPYYATMKGSLDPSDPAFESALLQALFDYGDDLFDQARSWRVQTNESSRGLAWLLPASLLQIPVAHLVELGASAGLNLYAEQRGYTLVQEGSANKLHLGVSDQAQFQINVKTEQPLKWGEKLKAPQIKSRFGADLEPLEISNEADALRLAACVWGDQPRRLARLQEAIDVHRKALCGQIEPEARVFPAKLPEDLEPFLRAAIPARAEGPVIVYNTYVTEYLSDVDERALTWGMREFARKWSTQQNLPWMWIRFEPPRPDQPSAPRRGWCKWEVELFTRSQHQVLTLGWAHPHFEAVKLGEGVGALLTM